MKGIELLILSKDQKKKLETSEKHYKRYARIYFSVLTATADEVVVKIWQRENTAEKYLTSKELIERAQGVFDGMLPAEAKLHIRPIPFMKDDIRNYSIKDIEKDMQDLGLQSKDLVKLLDIDKSSLSRLFNERELTKIHKAMFYYVFQYLKLKGEGNE